MKLAKNGKKKLGQNRKFIYIQIFSKISKAAYYHSIAYRSIA